MVVLLLVVMRRVSRRVHHLIKILDPELPFVGSVMAEYFLLAVRSCCTCPKRSRYYMKAYPGKWDGWPTFNARWSNVICGNFVVICA